MTADGNRRLPILARRRAGLTDDGRFATFDRDDISSACLAALLGDRHPGKTYHLTGPEALTLTEAAEVLRGQYDNP